MHSTVAHLKIDFKTLFNKRSQSLLSGYFLTGTPLSSVAVWALDLYVCFQKLVGVPVPACYLLRYLCYCWSLVIAMGGLEQGKHSVSQSQGASPSSKGAYLSFVGLLSGPLGTMSQEQKLQTDTEFLGPRKMAIHPMEQA